MSEVKSIPSDEFVLKLAAALKNKGTIKTQKWHDYVKTGCSRLYTPANQDWFYIRAAAMLRRLNSRDAAGTGAFRRVFGNVHMSTSTPHHFTKSSGGLIRNILKQLEAAKFVEKTDKGRRLSKKGQQFLNDFAKSIQN